MRSHEKHFRPRRSSDGQSVCNGDDLLFWAWHHASDSERQRFVSNVYDNLIEVAQACRRMAKLPQGL